VPQIECAVALAQENLKTSKWRLGFDIVATSQNLETRLHAVERVPPEGRGKPGDRVGAIARRIRSRVTLSFAANAT
jgi:hypothetical protein